VPGLPNRDLAYTVTPVTTPDGQQWYVFTAARGYSVDKSLLDFNGDDASTAFTVPTQLRPSRSPNWQIQGLTSRCQT
jgi:hypothetical protein